MDKTRCLLLAALAVATTAALAAQAGQKETASPNAQSAAPQAVPVMDGGAGPCTLDLSVTTDGKPATVADVKVHIAYGFGGMRRLDLEAYTNYDGKVRFTGLPVRVHRPPLEFRVSKDQLSGIAVYDPEGECHATHSVALLPQRPDTHPVDKN
jgi:hypothetical protein